MRCSLVIYAVLMASALAACGQRGPLYIPGKPGDPYYDRQNRGTAPTSPNAPNSIKPAPAPKREDDGTS